MEGMWASKMTAFQIAVAHALLALWLSLGFVGVFLRSIRGMTTLPMGAIKRLDRTLPIDLLVNWSVLMGAACAFLVGPLWLAPLTVLLGWGFAQSLFFWLGRFVQYGVIGSLFPTPFLVAFYLVACLGV